MYFFCIYYYSQLCKITGYSVEAKIGNQKGITSPPVRHSALLHSLSRNRIQANECQKLKKILYLRLKSFKDKCKEGEISKIFKSGKGIFG